MATATTSTTAGYSRGTSPSYDPLGRGGVGGLRDILERYFLPQLKRTQDTFSPIQDAFLSQVSTPGANFGAAATAANSYAKQLFAPGGDVATAIRKVRGQSIASGFEPQSAYGAENGILNTATQQVSNVFGQQAAGLESDRLKAFSGAFGQLDQDQMDLIQSLFTGVGSAEQLGLAKHPPRQKFLGIF